MSKNHRTLQYMGFAIYILIVLAFGCFAIYGALNNTSWISAYSQVNNVNVIVLWNLFSEMKYTGFFSRNLETIKKKALCGALCGSTFIIGVCNLHMGLALERKLPVAIVVMLTALMLIISSMVYLGDKKAVKD